MNPQDEPSRQATRRRVRVFVTVGILAVLVVGFWPLRGYEIEDHDAFFKTLGAPFVHSPLFYYDEDTPVTLSIGSDDHFALEGEFENLLIAVLASPRPDIVLHPERTARAWVYVGENADLDYFILDFYYRNLSGRLTVDASHPDFPKGKTMVEVGFEHLDTILDAVEREAPGVGRIYLPPAVHLWNAKVAPFLKEHFPGSATP